MQGKHQSSIVKTLIQRYFSDGISQSAAELSYFLLFTFCPLLMFLTAVLAQVPLPETSVAILSEFLPLDVQEVIIGYMEYIRSMPSLQPMMAGTIMTLYFLSRAVRSLMCTMNAIYRVPRRTGTLRRGILSLMLSAGFLLAIFSSILLMICGRTIFRLIHTWFPLFSIVADSIERASYPMTAAFLFLFVLVINRVVPNIKLRWRDAAPGAALSVAAWLFLSYVFSFYVDNMANYSLLYGSLGAIIALMLWLYLSSIILLLGAILNHIFLTHRQERMTAVNNKNIDDN